jgi:hypothetical protein
MAIVAYLTHPLGERDDGDGIERGTNMSNAMDWFKFLVDTTQWAIICPWFVYVAAVDDAFRRPRALRDQIEIMCRADVVVLTGGRMSAHMRVELSRSQRRVEGAIPVIDLLPLGFAPPWDRRDRVAQDIRSLAASLGL